MPAREACFEPPPGLLSPIQAKLLKILLGQLPLAATVSSAHFLTAILDVGSRLVDAAEPALEDAQTLSSALGLQ